MSLYKRLATNWDAEKNRGRQGMEREGKNFWPLSTLSKHLNLWGTNFISSQVNTLTDGATIDKLSSKAEKTARGEVESPEGNTQLICVYLGWNLVTRQASFPHPLFINISLRKYKVGFNKFWIPTKYFCKYLLKGRNLASYTETEYCWR